MLLENNKQIIINLSLMLILQSISKLPVGFGVHVHFERKDNNKRKKTKHNRNSNKYDCTLIYKQVQVINLTCFFRVIL